MNREFVTEKEWQCLSIESRNAINAHWVEYHRLVSRAEKAEAENKRLREALESLRETEHYECEDCFYSCPKTGACFKEVPDYAECTCGMDRRNAIIDKALKGGE